MHRETASWRLRPMEERDAPALADLWSDPETTRWLGGPRDWTFVHDDVVADVRGGHQPEGDALWTLEDLASGTVAGHCGLLKKTVDGQDFVETTYVVAPSHRGRGWATEVAAALVSWARERGETAVIALIVPGNEASRRVAQKTGMTLWKTTTRDDGSVREVWRV